MKRCLLFTTTLVCLISIARAQGNEFEWADTSFVIGQKRVIDLKFAFDGPCTVSLCSSYENNGATIDTLLNFLAANPSLMLEIGFHEDEIGHKDYNQDLTDLWAQATVRKLISKGVERDRFICKGYGALKPIISSAEIGNMKSKGEQNMAHRKNKRVELVIMKT